jgi:hypothetical protein
MKTGVLRFHSRLQSRILTCCSRGWLWGLAAYPVAIAGPMRGAICLAVGGAMPAEALGEAAAAVSFATGTRADAAILHGSGCSSGGGHSSLGAGRRAHEAMLCLLRRARCCQRVGGMLPARCSQALLGLDPGARCMRVGVIVVMLTGLGVLATGADVSGVATIAIALLSIESFCMERGGGVGAGHVWAGGEGGGSSRGSCSDVVRIVWPLFPCSALLNRGWGFLGFTQCPLGTA